MVFVVTNFYGQDFLTTKNLTVEDIMHFMHLAKQLKDNKSETTFHGLLNGKTMASLFFEPSTRTRISTETAMTKLGGKVNGFAGIESTSVKKGECLCDTLQMLAGYDYDIVAMRHPLQGSSQLAADYLDTPVVNCGEGPGRHPTQGMLDAFTMFLEKGRLDDLVIGYVGDLKYGRTVHSNINLLSHFSGIRFLFAAPEIVGLQEQYTRLLDKRGSGYEIFGPELEAIIDKVDVLYVTRVQEERFDNRDEYLKAASMMQLTKELVEKGKKDLIILHPLPRNKFAREITYEVDSMPQAKYYEQAANGLFMRQAIIYSILHPIAARATDLAPVQEHVESVLRKLPVKPRNPDKTKDQRLPDIENGTVFDHIPVDKGYTVVKLIRRNVSEEHKRAIEYAGNLTGESGDPKDVVKTRFKIEDERLLSQIALVSEDIRYNIIHDYKVVEKAELKLPTMIRDVVQCPNPRCITAPEHSEKLPEHKAYHHGDFLECHYCATEFQKESVLKTNKGLLR